RSALAVPYEVPDEVAATVGGGFEAAAGSGPVLRRPAWACRGFAAGWWDRARASGCGRVRRRARRRWARRTAPPVRPPSPPAGPPAGHFTKSSRDVARAWMPNIQALADQGWGAVFFCVGYSVGGGQPAPAGIGRARGVEHGLHLRTTMNALGPAWAGATVFI